MKTYLVGGAVRDAYLGINSHDKDYVVVGGDVTTMLAQGYEQVGKDFPVFLHPITKQEHALARTERKSGRGYHGFEVCADPTVTLEDDLLRRDLTINAMAQDTQGNLIDPYGGKQDLDDRILRHVSISFCEDPLRVLRVARFAARFASLGFKIADETLLLMQQMVEAGELDYLTPERVWQETQRALSETDAFVYFEVLQHCGALSVLMPELIALIPTPSTLSYSPDTTPYYPYTSIPEQSNHQLRFACQQQTRIDIRFALLCQPLTRQYAIQKATAMLTTLCQRLKTPKSTHEIADLTLRYYEDFAQLPRLDAYTLFELIQHLDGMRRYQRLTEVATACQYIVWADAYTIQARTSEADYGNIINAHDDTTPQAPLLTRQDYLLNAVQKIQAIGQKDIDPTLKGMAIGKAIRQKRLEVLTQYIQQHQPNIAI